VRLAVALGLAFLQTASAIAQEANLDAAIAAFIAGDAAPALPVLESHARQGDAKALLYLGRAYYEGKGVAADLARAAESFASASERGDVNAPVWAGQAYEALGDAKASTRMHRVALERALHVTSMLALGNAHRRGTIAGASQIASARYFASAQVVMDGYGAAVPKQDYLGRFSCFELTQAAFVEVRSSSAEPLQFSDLTGDFLACTRTGDKAALKQRLASAVGQRLNQRGNAVIDENASIFNFLDAKPDPRRRVLPSPFKGYVAFASDADGDVLDASLSGQRFLNDHLGLPIASSVFVTTTFKERFPKTSPNPERPAPQYTSFFTGIDQPDIAPIDGLPKFFALARAWHRGRYDHLHSWYGDSETLLLRPAAALKGAVTIPLAPLFGKVAPRYRETGQILRLYFSAKPAEDLRLAFRTREGETIAVNSATLVNSQRTELDEGQSRYVVALRLPAAFPQFAIAPDRKIGLDRLVSLELESPSCQDACGVVMEKVEIGGYDRTSAIFQARLLRTLNIRPYGYTSHGGEGWHVHGDPGLLDAFWTQLKSETASADTVHRSPSFTLANIPQSKGYIEDLLSEIGTRAIRPERLPGDRPSYDAIHDWNAPYKMFGLYRDKLNFATTYFEGEPDRAASLADKLAYYRSRLAGSDDLVGATCRDSNCDPAQNGLLALLVQASRQKAVTADAPFSHIWYTHFGAPTATLAPTPARPFTDTAKAAFEGLAEAKYGLKAEGGTSDGARVLTVASTTALRARKLEFILDSGLMTIDRRGDAIRFAASIDPLLGGVFPAPGHAGRDLFNLSFAVNDVFAATLGLEGERLAVSRRRVEQGEGSDAGEVSIVDAETAMTVLLEASSTGPATQLGLGQISPGGEPVQACAKPAQPLAIFNASHLAFANPFHALHGAGDLDVTLAVRPHEQQAFGLGRQPLKRHVFSTRPDAVAAAGAGTVVHAIDLPRDAARQPEDVVVNLALPKRYLPGATPSVGELNLDGVLEELCVNLKLTAGAGGNAALGPLKIISPTLQDAPDKATGLAVGGRVSRAAATAPEPAALQFTAEAGRDSQTIALDRGYYLGRLPESGTYRVRLLQSSCSDETPATVLLEQSRLDLDVEIAGCRLNFGVPSP